VLNGYLQLLGNIRKNEQIFGFLIQILSEMATVDKIRNGLIDKILSIKNKDFLVALDKLITSSSSESEIVELTKEQKEMLEMSEQDITNGKLISQEAMDKRNLEWLNAM
jgi:archaellum component FlaF (FlaF/FlaG flagellin family)